MEKELRYKHEDHINTSDHCSVSLSENLMWTRLLLTGGTRSLGLSADLSHDLSADVSLCLTSP